MRRYNLLWEVWNSNGPPVYMSVAGYLGLIKPADKKKSPIATKDEPGNLNDLLKMFPTGMIQ